MKNYKCWVRQDGRKKLVYRTAISAYEMVRLLEAEGFIIDKMDYPQID